MEPPPAAGTVQVVLRIRQNANPIEVWTVSATPYPIGIVAASSHADVALLGLSGLEYSAETDGTLIRLRELR